MRIPQLLAAAFLLFTSAASASLCCIIPGESFREPEMVKIPGGSFEIGSARDSDNPVRTVNIKSFEMGKYEVTQGQWKAIMGSNPSRFKKCGANCPVESVSWSDVQEFLAKLNQKTGKQYRLPTDDEWEYACYGGIKTRYCGGDDIDAVAWCGGNSGSKTHPVGRKQANGYGLYDMSGNVWEWMENKYSGSSDGRALRGGSWSNIALSVRAVDRFSYDPASREDNYGFRLVRTLP